MKKTKDKIAEKAYYKYLDKGSQNGDDLNDWLEAEKEVKKDKSTAKKPAKTSKAAVAANKPVKAKKTASGSKKKVTVNKTTSTKTK